MANVKPANGVLPIVVLAKGALTIVILANAWVPLSLPASSFDQKTRLHSNFDSNFGLRSIISSSARKTFFDFEPKNIQSNETNFVGKSGFDPVLQKLSYCLFQGSA